MCVSVCVYLQFLSLLSWPKSGNTKREGEGGMEGERERAREKRREEEKGGGGAKRERDFLSVNETLFKPQGESLVSHLVVFQVSFYINQFT